jgi:hypothetical protein
MPYLNPLVLENRGDLPASGSTDGINYHLLFPREESHCIGLDTFTAIHDEGTEIFTE